jgi:hypothetical protein
MAAVPWSGCRPAQTPQGIAARATVAFDPEPATVGVTGLTVTLTDDSGNPIRVNRLEVEGNMNHAGMRPAFAQLNEVEPGRYAGSIEFSMAGDWFLLLSGEVPGEGRLEVKVDVPAVRPR